jgi:hypothetical protein
MPTPKGMIEVRYTRTGSGIDGDITLPPNVTGELLAAGQQFKLHQGNQRLQLPPTQ